MLSLSLKKITISVFHVVSFFPPASLLPFPKTASRCMLQIRINPLNIRLPGSRRWGNRLFRFSKVLLLKVGLAQVLWACCSLFPQCVRMPPSASTSALYGGISATTLVSFQGQKRTKDLPDWLITRTWLKFRRVWLSYIAEAAFKGLSNPVICNLS